MVDYYIENNKLSNKTKMKKKFDSFYFKFGFTRDILHSSLYIVLQFIIEPVILISSSRSLRLKMEKRKK